MGRFRIVVVVAALVLGACGWTQYGGNAGRTGANESEHSFTAANASNVEVRWSTDRGVSDVAIAGGFLYGAVRSEITAGNGPYVMAWRTATCAPNAYCAPEWRADTAGAVALSRPSVAGDFLLVAARFGDDWQLMAFSAAGTTGCAGSTPKVCAPLWTSALGPEGYGPSALAATGDHILISATDGVHPSILVLDSHATRNCGGTPRVCTALFTLTPSLANPFVAAADGRAYVSDADGIAVYALDGVTGCIASRCSPIRIMNAGSHGQFSVSGGTLYTTAGTKLLAFDATLATHCDGPLPATCTPIWRGTLLKSAWSTPPVVSAGHVFVSTASGEFPVVGGIESFDAAGVERCNLTTHTCSRQWRTAVDDAHPSQIISASADVLVSATRQGEQTINDGYQVRIYDARGATGCGGSPRACAPVRTFELRRSLFPQLADPPAIGDGMIVWTEPTGLSGAIVFGLP